MDTQSLTNGFSDEIHSLFGAVRTKVLELLPTFTEELDQQAGLLAFSIKEGYKGTVFTLIPAKDHVTVGIFRGASLPDPHHLMVGTGKVHRHVKIQSKEQLNTNEFSQLLQAALDAAKLRLGI